MTGGSDAAFAGDNASVDTVSPQQVVGIELLRRIAQDTDEQSAPIDFNPYVECNLCAAAFPVGAIVPHGHLKFQACLTQNHHAFLGGFADWIEEC